MIPFSERKPRENRKYGPPCPHHPDKYEYEAQHQAKLDSKRRCDARNRMEKPIRCFESWGYPIKRRIQLILAAARRRCRVHPRYAGRGIKCLITHDDLLFIWNRDGANDMARPSLDRINNDGHYESSNIRFVELYDNISAGTQVRESLRDCARKNNLN